MADILLTGGSGFVGRQILKLLLDDGHQVRLVLRHGGPEKIPALAAKCKILVCDDLFAQSAEWWQQTCGGIDVVIHCAWYVEHGKYQDSPRNLDCVAGSLRLVEGAVAAGVSHFVGAGTCMEYRLPSAHLDIDAPLEPGNLYAAAKLSLFYLLTQYLAKTACRLTWCRLFYLHGEGEIQTRLAPYIHGQMAKGEVAKLSHGAQLRDFIDVVAAGRMIADTVRTKQAGPVNICSGVSQTIRSFAENIADQYGRRDLLEFSPVIANPHDPMAVVGVCNAIAWVEQTG